MEQWYISEKLWQITKPNTTKKKYKLQQKKCINQQIRCEFYSYQCSYYFICLKYFRINCKVNIANPKSLRLIVKNEQVIEQIHV